MSSLGRPPATLVICARPLRCEACTSPARSAPRLLRRPRHRPLSRGRTAGCDEQSRLSCVPPQYCTAHEGAARGRAQRLHGVPRACGSAVVGVTGMLSRVVRCAEGSRRLCSACLAYCGGHHEPWAWTSDRSAPAAARRLTAHQACASWTPGALLTASARTTVAAPVWRDTGPGGRGAVGVVRNHEVGAVASCGKLVCAGHSADGGGRAAALRHPPRLLHDATGRTAAPRPKGFQ